jgi:hypothetical protein
MRYNEIITELKMNPNHLAKFGKTTGDTILAGFEAEIILNAVLETKEEPDYDYDGKIPRRADFDDIANFFDIRRNRHMHDLSDAEDEFKEWQEEEIQSYINSNLGDTAQHLMDKHNEHVEDDDDMLPVSEFQDEAQEMCEKAAEHNLDLSLHEFLTVYLKIEKYSELAEYYNITWPHMRVIEPDGYDYHVAEDHAQSLSKILNKRIVTNGSYHGGRYANTYHVEPDGSLQADSDEDMGMEIISYPMPLPEMINDLEKTMKWIDRNAYTNESTGLHINMSIPNGGKIDYTKLVLFLGDQHVLSQFNREANDYAESAFDLLRGDTKTTGDQAFIHLKNGLIDIAGQALRERNSAKYTSVNMHDTYVEFRSLGGDYVGKWTDIKNSILRFAQALTVACNPELERKEYTLKLYKLLQNGQSGTTDIIKVFSLYSAGDWSKDTLRQYLKNRADQRKEDNSPF